MLLAVNGTQIYPPTTRAWLEIDSDALLHNARALQRHTGLPLLPMVKADAYGVGCDGVVAALEGMEPWGYGVATVPEGERLRRIGVRRPIVIFTPILPPEFDAARAADLTPSLCSDRAIREWAHGGGGKYHLAIDTGMNRAGVSWRDASCLRAAVIAHPPAAAYTHFHSAESGDGSVREQEERFRTAIGQLGVPIPMLHVANSAAAAGSGAGGGTRWDAVRPGIFLYGVGTAGDDGLVPRPVVTMRGRVVDLHRLRPGDTVSYGATYTAAADEVIATVAVGYADGYPRALSGVGSALLNGTRLPVRGRVTMDMTMFDVSHTQCDIGDAVTLLGSEEAGSSNRAIAVAEVAAAAQMSPYELLTGLGPRLPRIFRSGAAA